MFDPRFQFTFEIIILIKVSNLISKTIRANNRFLDNNMLVQSQLHNKIVLTSNNNLSEDIHTLFSICLILITLLNLYLLSWHHPQLESQHELSFTGNIRETLYSPSGERMEHHQDSRNTTVKMSSFLNSP